MANSCDIVIIGAGIAGASLAAALVKSGRQVALVEREAQPGYHSTGRSAASYVPNYGPPAIQALTQASGGFFRSPPDGFCETDLLAPRGELMIAGPANEADIGEARKLGLKDISFDEIKRRIPPFRPENFTAALIDESAWDLDVDALHQGFLRQFRAGNGSLTCNAEVTGLRRSDGTWHISTSAGDWQAPVIVNAAGAWVDVIAGLAGLVPIGLEPRRRSAALITVPDDWNVTGWPLVFGAGETWYCRPMGGKLMLSPAEATPVEPHDAWADDMKIAEAVEHFQDAIDFEVTRLDHTWGGLRSFVDDGDPVNGFDPETEGFYWLAGQGGYGIQTSPAMADFAAAMIMGEPAPDYITAEGLRPSALSPNRIKN